MARISSSRSSGSYDDAPPPARTRAGNGRGKSSQNGGQRVQAQPIPVARPAHDVGVRRTRSAVRWQTGLCDCFDDCNGCLYVTFCPGCALMSNRALIEERQVDGVDKNWGWTFMLTGPSAPGILACMACQERETMIAKYGLGEWTFGQKLTGFFCAPCAMCQTRRELLLSHEDADPWAGCCQSTFGENAGAPADVEWVQDTPTPEDVTWDAAMVWPRVLTYFMIAFNVLAAIGTVVLAVIRINDDKVRSAVSLFPNFVYFVTIALANAFLVLRAIRLSDVRRLELGVWLAVLELVGWLIGCIGLLMAGNVVVAAIFFVITIFAGFHMVLLMKLAKVITHSGFGYGFALLSVDDEYSY